MSEEQTRHRRDRLRRLRPVRAAAVRAGSRRAPGRHGRHRAAGRAGGRPALRRRGRDRRRPAPRIASSRSSLHLHAAVSALRASQGSARSRQARHLRKAARADRGASRRVGGARAAARPPARRQLDAAVQPAVRHHRPGHRTPAARRVAARLLRELRLRRKPAARALVLGPREKRRDLRRARRALLRHVGRLARTGRSRRRAGQPPRRRLRGPGAVHGAIRGRRALQFLSRLSPAGPAGPPGAAAGLRARRYPAARLGADERAHSRRRRRVADAPAVRSVSRRTDRRADDVRPARPRILLARPPARRLSTIRAALGQGLQKMPLYCELLRRMMTDQALDSRPQAPAKDHRTKRPRFGRDGLCGGQNGRSSAKRRMIKSYCSGNSIIAFTAASAEWKLDGSA